MARKAQGHLDIEEQIYQLTTLVAGEFSLQEVLDKLAEAAVRIAGVKACSIRLLDEDSGDLKMRSTFGLSEQYRNRGVVSKEDAVIRTAFGGQAVVLDDMRVDGRVKHKEAAIKEGLVSQLTVAMQFRGKPIGVLRLYSPKPKQFGEDDIALARAVASQCAVAITNARLYARAIEGARVSEQMRLAGAVQRRMIPDSAPVIRGLDIAAAYIPCFDVGGDFYDFFQVSESRIAMGIADVMGKGIPAAIMMSCFRGSVRAYADVLGSHRDQIEAYVQAEGRQAVVKSIINRLNQMACRECSAGEFITLFYASVDSQENTVTYCNCGHEPGVLIRDRRVVNLDKGGLVLGVMPDAEYEIETVQLKNGDVLMLYTDGLIDAPDFEGQFWGRERMLKVAVEFCDDPADRLIKNILGNRRRFVGLASQCDDTSMIVVKVNKTQ